MKQLRKNIAYTLLCILLTISCKEKIDIPLQETSPMPMFFSVISHTQTKGYVEGTDLYDTHKNNLHSSTSPSPRTINVTAWHYPQSGTEKEYFNNEIFSIHPDEKWHHAPALYWPMGGVMDFMAYSCTLPFPAGCVKWDGGRSTDRLFLRFDRAYTQDDVLFSFAGGKRSSDDYGNVPMLFSHAQAWIQFRLKAKDANVNNVVTLYGITVKDIYTTGELTINHQYGAAAGEWDFRFDRREDILMDDNDGVYATGMTTTVKYLDMLLPEQLMKDFVLEYTLEGSDLHLYYQYHMPTATWQMGKKYIYEITFAPNEILVAPSVEDWQESTSNVNIP